MNFRALVLSFLLQFTVMAFSSVDTQKTFDLKFPNESSWSSSSEWKKIYKDIKDHKLKKALTQTKLNLKRFSKENDQLNWTISLILKHQLLNGLHKVETSLIEFHKDEWPKNKSSQILLELYYAQSLMNYFDRYSWEISQREQLLTSQRISIKKWSKADISKEISKSLRRVWQSREKLQFKKTQDLKAFIKIGTFPSNIRGNLRDTISYLYAHFLKNSAYWSARQENELKEFELKSFLKLKNTELTKPKLHPLKLAILVLKDLEKWHWRNDQLGPLLEARFESVRTLQASFTTNDDRRTLNQSLKLFLRDYKSSVWWAEGMFLRASIVNLMGHSTAKIEARAIARLGRDTYPESIGGKRCQYLINEVEKSTFKFKSMKFDVKNRKSFEIRHKNIDNIFFRAYEIDPIKYLLSHRDYNTVPSYADIKKIIKKNKPSFEWQAKLKNTHDFREHKTLLTPEIKKNGFYIVLSSANKRFSFKQNQLLSTFYQQTNLYLLHDLNKKNKFYFKVSHALNNKPVVGASLVIYKLDWKKGHSAFKTIKTDKKGEAYFKKHGNGFLRSVFFIKYKNDSAFFSDQVYLNSQKKKKRKKTNHALIYTDRNIFRPNQNIKFKIMSFSRDPKKNGRPSLSSNKNITVELLDSNSKVVSKMTVKTNSFGTAAGEFHIPRGRALGIWYLRSKHYEAFKYIKVEEYKRPTFMAKILEAKGEIRLNQKVVIKGMAKYYFGLGVSDARVKFSVSRSSNVPYWYRWWYPNFQVNTEIIKIGTVRTNTSGEFDLGFTPKSTKNNKGVQYTFNISVEVLNEGGETVSISKKFTVGALAVKASISSKSKYHTSDINLNFSRMDLNNKPLSGVARFDLFRLKMPAKTLSPAEQPLFFGVMKPPEDKFTTSDDYMRSRWSGAFSNSFVLKTLKTKKLVTSGDLSHDKKGQAKYLFSDLAPGAYRLKYQTNDSFGGIFKTNFNFIVIQKKSALKLPFVFLVNSSNVHVGDMLEFFMHSGLGKQHMTFELFRGDKLVLKRLLVTGKSSSILKYKVNAKDLGGLVARYYGVADHTFMQKQINISVPHIKKKLDINFERIRYRLYSGTKVKWKLKIKSHDRNGMLIPLTEKSEILAFMYDKSLDVFGKHGVSRLIWNTGIPYFNYGFNLFPNLSYSYTISNRWHKSNYFPNLTMDKLHFFSSYAIGGMGIRGGGMMESDRVSAAPVMMAKTAMRRERKQSGKTKNKEQEKSQNDPLPENTPVNKLRTNFAETGFWKPQLLTNKKGDLEFSFTVPDSLTSWSVWAQAVTKDLKYGLKNIEVQSVKDLMVRTYFPRFLRQGDKISLKVIIDNGGKIPLSGVFNFKIQKNDKKNVSKLFSIDKNFLVGTVFNVLPGKSTSFTIPIIVPSNKLGLYEFIATAKTKNFLDGEVKKINILPGRMHLVESKFIALTNKESRTIQFKNMLVEDETRLNDKLIIKLDSQLFYSVLLSLPYLHDYPYKNMFYFLNYYTVTSILNDIYKSNPAIVKMISQLKQRKNRLEKWNGNDPNRSMSLAETPWLTESEGGSSDKVFNMLIPRVVQKRKKQFLTKILEFQTNSGGFSWFKGGAPSVYMTIQFLKSMSRVAEFGGNIPKEAVRKSWKYIGIQTRKMIDDCILNDRCYETISLINFTTTSFKDQSLYRSYISKNLELKMLDFSFSHWKEHSPRLKSMLALTLKRANRVDDAKLVFESVMDSSSTEKDLGVYWAPEDRAWLWYNDSIESHAFALRANMEIFPKSTKSDGLVKWLFLNKKLNHWKSTRATAEVIYSLVHYLKANKQLSSPQTIEVKVGNISKKFNFSPEKFSGKDNFLIIAGTKIINKSMNTIEINQASKGISFASATWHYSTEKLPKDASGDLFSVTRSFFKRTKLNNEIVLIPLKQNVEVSIGDQIEVHITINVKHASEYVHLRDPRPSGFEPKSSGIISGHKWDLGLTRYEEIRDSGMNFFFERLPVGEYTLKHRLRANLAGKFRTHPVILQSMYAPEFNAYSSGKIISVD